MPYSHYSYSCEVLLQIKATDSPVPNIPENVHANNITWTKQFTFKNVAVYKHTCMYACKNNWWGKGCDFEEQWRKTY